MKKQILAAIVLMTISVTSFSATLTSMNKKQVMDALQNKTLTTIPFATLNGELVKDTITLFLDKNGQIDGKFASAPAKDLQSDRGVWKVSPEGALCVSWDHWDQGQKQCVMVYDVKNSLLFVAAKNNKFESLVLKENIKSGNQF